VPKGDGFRFFEDYYFLLNMQNGDAAISEIDMVGEKAARLHVGSSS
jgi:hypothetical protein